jgi:hypothetical protein
MLCSEVVSYASSVAKMEVPSTQGYVFWVLCFTGSTGAWFFYLFLLATWMWFDMVQITLLKSLHFKCHFSFS